jgi:hypothetical protein
MLLKISKITPRCPKWLPGDEYTRESQLLGGKYTAESRLPCEEYPGSRLLSVVWTSIRTGLQQIFSWIIDQGIKTPQCIKRRKVLTPWSILHQKVLLLTNLGRLPSVFTTPESQLPGDEYTGESITNSNNSSNIQKNLKSFLGVYNGTRRRCLMKKTE